YFFEKDMEKENQAAMFDGLQIMKAGEKYIKYMGQYPVVFLTLKSAKQPNFEMAYESILDEIAKEFRRHNDILESGELMPEEAEQFVRLRSKKASAIEYAKALEFLTGCLKKVYRKKVIILVDEYDVPLENAWFSGFYDKMAAFIRSLFESAFKSNPNLEFAVMTGCLRIARESIFTGLNNLEVISILNRTYAEYFGFTVAEVKKMLEDYGIEGKQEEVKRWYDGYLFGETEVYNPWSVINYVKNTVGNTFEWPKAYWANTSSNDIVRGLVERADGTVRQEIENLIGGGTIEKPIHEDITYEEIYKTQDNLWNFLFFTGYLKKTKERFDGRTLYLTMKIPNEEVTGIYQNTIIDWYDKRIRQKDFTAFFQALLKKDTEVLERELSMNLMETISFYDYKEDYYHAYTAGLLKFMDGYLVKSNRESGMGRSDIMVLSAPYERTAVIIEIKVADTYAGLDAKAQEALNQISDRKYSAELELEGYRRFIKYGFAFYKKLCRVLTE
ncbi:MAG: ATP-binding protein, partial [Clostridium sp.]|nr:ATP-binding protein [Clostridium sp.]